MNREIIQEALNGIRDEYITEAGAKLGLLAVGAAAVTGAASTAAVDSANLYSLSTTEAAAKTGFGAWVTKGGWVALAAGVLVAAGIAVGAFFLGKGGDMPPAKENDITTEEEDQSLPEEDVTEESDESESESREEISSETDTSETDPPKSLYFQFPLTDANDTTSYVSLPDGSTEGYKALEFFIQPTDTDTPKLTSALQLILPADGQANIQVVSFKNEEMYGFIFMLESAYIDRLNGIETQFVRMECSTISFFNDKTMTVPPIRYYHMDGGGSANFQYTAQNRKSMLTKYRNTNRAALERSENLIDKYSDSERFEYTILYSYVDGVEIINTPVESIPEFDFSIFNEYGFDN